MIINHNLAAMNTYRQYSINNSDASKSLQKLSSGLRINSAADDAAGLAISEKMRSQIRGLDQATSNAQDAISLVQTAEGALSETESILQRMRELSVQSSNDTATDSDRTEMQKEIEQLKSEIDRISTDTEFNTKKLLDGSVNYDIANTSNAAKLDNLTITDSKYDSGSYTVTIANSAVSTSDFIGASGIATGDVTLETTGSGLKAGGYTIELSGATDNATFTLKDANGTVVGQANGADSATDVTIQINGEDAVTIAGGAYDGNSGKLSFDVNITADVTISGGNATGTTHTAVASDEYGQMKVDGFTFDVGADITDGTRVDTVTDNGLVFHIGANQGQTTKLNIGEVDTETLNVDDIDISSQDGAETAISSLDQAINSVSSERSKLGAIQNRLEHTINNLGTSSENLTSAESRIRDVDMAKEMMNYQKTSILQQAAQAMLAQANQQPQGVLKLLQ
jgi:flagellin